MQNGNALKYAPDIFKNNPDIVIPCIDKFPWAFEYCSHELKQDKTIIETATKKVKWVSIDDISKSALEYTEKIRRLL